MDPATIPVEVEEASARLRALATDRRLLVVLDNAHSSGQVRPLLPASPTCAVLVTSRQVLATPDGAHPLHLDLLPPTEAVELLGKLAGPDRIRTDPDAAQAVVRYCGLLPLAIRIAGARLKARPNWPVGELARLLADATRRLSELTADGLGVRAAFDVSLHALQHSADLIDQAAAGAFGLLSLPDGPDLDVTAAARLLDQSEPTTQTLLERLVDAQLLETPRPGRYQFHDLVRLYARHHAHQQHPEPARLAALGWLEAERANLLTTIGQTATTTPAIPARRGTELTRALFGFFEVHSHWTDQLQANQTALELACRTADQTGQAHTHNGLGAVYYWLGRYPEALDHQRQALTLFRELGDRHGQAEALRDLGDALLGLGHHQQAREAWQEALEICETLQVPEADEVRDRLARLPAGPDEPDEPAAAGASTAAGAGLTPSG